MEAGGTQTFLMNIYRNIDRTKIQFDFFVEYPNEQFFDNEIESLGGHIYRSSFRTDGNIFKFKKKFKKILTENNYAIVHVHAYTIGYFCLKVAKQCGVKIRIAHSHNNQMPKDKFYVLKQIMKYLYPKYANYYMACSKEAGDFLFSKYKYIVIKNAIDVSKFKFNPDTRNIIRKKLAINDFFVIGNVGRLHIQKNQLFLLDVFDEIRKKIKKTKLIIIGNGPMKAEIIKKIDKLGINDQVILLSNQKKMSDLYQAMDIFLLPSLFEGLGIVAIEAQAAGLPTYCSTNVSKEASVSSLFRSIELGNPYKWAEYILQQNNQRNPHAGQVGAIQAGFDIKENALSLQNWYLNSYKEANK